MHSDYNQAFALANPSDHTTFEDFNSPIVQDNIVTIAGMIQEKDSNSEPVAAAFMDVILNTKQRDIGRT